MNIGNAAGIALGIKLVNGKIKPKFGKSAVIGMFFLILLILIFIVGFIYGVLSSEIELLFASSAVLLGSGYILLITPYTQNPKNYYIEFESENSLNNFKLSYKNKLVTIQYKIDANGKIAFLNNNSKLSCISYADGSKMNNLTKYRIINYFTKWLNDNGLMSDEITASFE